VANFVGLVEGTKKTNKPLGKPFYDGLTFHRIVPDYFIQGGDPEGTGNGGAGYFLEKEIHPDLKHNQKGTLSMFAVGESVYSSQFAITRKSAPFMDGAYPVFGYVIQGFSVIDSIASVPTNGVKPTSPISIKKMSILRIGKKAEAFKGGEGHFVQLRKQYNRTLETERRKRNQTQQQQVFNSAKAYGQQKNMPIFSTSSGMYYAVLQKGIGQQVTLGDTVLAFYSIRSLQGHVYEEAAKEPMRLAVSSEDAFAGWAESVRDMELGEKRLIFMPSRLAYGEMGYMRCSHEEHTIPPHENIVLELEVLEE
jgi:peptidylprolyl isomerase